MDFVNKFAGGLGNQQQSGNQGQNQGQGNSVNEQVVHEGRSNNGESQQSSGGGFLGGIGDKLNSAAGGGRESEKNEDYLDKGM